MKPTMTVWREFAANDVPEIGWFASHAGTQSLGELADLVALDLRFDTRGIEAKKAQSVTAAKNLVARIFDGHIGTPYLFKVEHRLQPRSSVRTYKGLFS